MPRKRRKKKIELDPEKSLKRIVPPSEVLRVMGTPESIMEYFELMGERNVRHNFVFMPNDSRLMESVLHWVQSGSITPKTLAELVFKRLQRSRNEYLRSIPRYAVFATVQVLLDVMRDLLIDGWRIHLFGIGSLGAEKKRNKLLLRRRNGKKEYAIVDYYVFYWTTSTQLKKTMMATYNPAIPWKEYKDGEKPWAEFYRKLRENAQRRWEERKKKEEGHKDHEDEE